MTHQINLEEIDVDGAVRESADAVSGDTRLSFLKKAGIAGGTAISGGAVISALAPSAFGASQPGRPPASFGKGDVGILNYALTLEYLEAAFYNGATEAKLALSPQAAAFLKVVTADENAHVAFLKKALGKKAVGAPKVNFGDATSKAKWLPTAMVLENTGVKAYGGQALNIKTPAYISAALSIWAVEARHASVAGLLVKAAPDSISPEKGAFQTTATAAEVLKAVEGTGFLV
jgi:hypothetical protein